jgi:hypothetical protein
VIAWSLPLSLPFVCFSFSSFIKFFYFAVNSFAAAAAVHCAESCWQHPSALL